MNQFLHLSKFEFSKKINDIAFSKKQQPELIEKQYYYQLLLTLIKIPTPCAEPSNLLLQVEEPHFDIDGNNLKIKQNIFDWLCTCNFLINKLKNLDLNFNFNKVYKDSITNLECILYFNSLFSEEVKTLSFTLYSTKDIKEDDNDTSGGNAPVLFNLEDKNIKLFLKNVPLAKQSQFFNISQKSFYDKIKTFIPKINQKTSNQIRKAMNLISDVAKSVIKNNPEKPLDMLRVKDMVDNIITSITKDSISSVLSINTIENNLRDFSDKQVNPQPNQQATPESNPLDINTKQSTPDIKQPTNSPNDLKVTPQTIKNPQGLTREKGDTHFNQQHKEVKTLW